MTLHIQLVPSAQKLMTAAILDQNLQKMLEFVLRPHSLLLNAGYTPLLETATENMASSNL